jgi:hypothetical protein
MLNWEAPFKYNDAGYVWLIMIFQYRRLISCYLSKVKLLIQKRK